MASAAMRETPPAWVRRILELYPEELHSTHREVRSLIREVALSDSRIGPVTETLRWGQLAYLTAETGAGSTIRLGITGSAPAECAIFFNCRTPLVERFRTLFVDIFHFEGNRAVIIRNNQPLPREALAWCLREAMTYHCARRKYGEETALHGA